MKSFFIGMATVVVLGAVVLAIVFASNSGNNSLDQANETGNKIVAKLYKSPNCGCCTNHAAYLRRNGFEVEVIETNDIASIKKEYSVPTGEQSCHTTIIDGYAVEGHVPVEAINQLLTDKPAVTGIGLAAMPAGSPGMPGPKQAPFEVYSYSAEAGVLGYSQY